MLQRRIVMCMFLLCSMAVTHVLAAPDPIVYYPFNELGSTVVDETGNGNDGTPKGGVSLETQGYFDQCFRFDGTDGHVELNRPIQDDFSILAWIQTSETAPGSSHAYQGNGLFWSDVGGAANDMVVAVLGTKLSFFAGNPDTSVNSDADIVTGEWVHIATVREAASGTMTLFINGVEDNSITHANRSALNAQPLMAIGGNTLDNRYYEGLIDDVLIYDAPLVLEDIQTTMIGQGAESAADPIPADGATDVLRDPVLIWTPGEFAATHNVYIGTSWDDVNDATVSEPLGVLASTGEEAALFEPGRLEFDMTYYWRVDEVNRAPDTTTFPGPVWSFTVESLAYPVVPVLASASSSFMPSMGPEKTIDGSGLNNADQHNTTGTDMWLTSPTDTERWIQYEFERPQKLYRMLVWNSNQNVESFIGFGLKTVTIETSLDGSTWTTLADTPEFMQAPGSLDYTHNTLVDFGGLTTQYIKLTIQAGWGSLPQYGLSEVRFLAIPVYASQPEPMQGGSAATINPTLTWRPGREAGTHEVVLSTDRAAVEGATAVVGDATDNRFSPATLSYGTEYFWRINEVNTVAETTRYAGEVWNFLAPEYLVLDDFEMYEDEEFLEIWAFWADGYQDDNNGSIVGNGNIGERSIVFNGRQSMPIHFDNSSASVSEVTRSFSPSLDFTQGDPEVLALSFRGQPAGFTEDADGNIVMSAAGNDIWNQADQFRYAYKTLNGNGSMTVKVNRLDETHPWAKAAVMIRETTAAESIHASTVMSAANGIQLVYRDMMAASSSSFTQSNLSVPYWLRISREGNTITAERSEDGLSWVTVTTNADQSSVDLTMTDEVLIGLAVTSHASGVTTIAGFSDVSFSGGVSGDWTVEAIGVDMPSNEGQDPLYVTVGDSANQSVTELHPEPTAIQTNEWQDWLIPMSQLSSLKLSEITSITIGIGYQDGSQVGSDGTVYIDDLRLGTPLPVVEDPNTTSAN